MDSFSVLRSYKPPLTDEEKAARSKSKRKSKKDKVKSEDESETECFGCTHATCMHMRPSKLFGKPARKKQKK